MSQHVKRYKRYEDVKFHEGQILKLKNGSSAIVWEPDGRIYTIEQLDTCEQHRGTVEQLSEYIDEEEFLITEE